MEQNAPIAKAELAEAPARKVVRVFGEAEAMRIVGLSSAALKKWLRSKVTGGGGGLVPSYYQALYLRAAQAKGLPLDAGDFIAEPY